jgi:hypothetical protein
MAARLLLFPGRHTNCRYAVTWTGQRIHRRYGRRIWCDVSRDHAGPPNPGWLREWQRCEKCFPAKEAA